MYNFEFECARCGLGSGGVSGDIQDALHSLVHEGGWQVLEDGSFICLDCRTAAMVLDLENANVLAAGN